MIAFLDGVVMRKNHNSAYINVSGVGFEVNMSSSSLSDLPGVGEKALVYTYMQVRDDGMSLYGFLKEEEKALFEKLIAISGVGPKVALAVLSVYKRDELVSLIASDDIGSIQKVPGVGKKMASRIVLELKSSLEGDLSNLFENSPSGNQQSIDDARSALLSMGFTLSEANMALAGAPCEADENALIKYALKKLGS